MAKKNDKQTKKQRASSSKVLAEKTEGLKAEQGEKTISAPQPPEQKIEESKYNVPSAAQSFGTGQSDIPYGYGGDRIVLLVRDPRWLHSYWEISEDRYNEARRSLGERVSSASEILRVYDASSDKWASFDIKIFGGARNWYINVPAPDRTYVVDIGYLAQDGTFFALARSNAVRTPREGISDVIDEEWMTIDFDRIYALSGGFGIGKSSGEIKKLLERHLMAQKSSGWVTSMSSPFGGAPERPFFLVANTELVLYGATEPTAQLYVQGKRIPLRRDGTFSMRFALPDGNQNIPIEAIRDDGKEKRRITKTVEKRTR